MGFAKANNMDGRTRRYMKLWNWGQPSRGVVYHPPLRSADGIRPALNPFMLSRCEASERTRPGGRSWWSASQENVRLPEGELVA